jgi:arylsulfatase A-like enzyme
LERGRIDSYNARVPTGLVLTRRRFLGALAAGGAWALACSPTRRPNLLVLVSDDQRADTLGCMGNPTVHSPHLDALAAQGVTFDRAFVTTSVCPSSRASILTGQYTRRHGVHDFEAALAPDALADTYPLRLRAAGYRTGFVGKWGVGSHLPSEAFDFFRGFAGQGSYVHEVQGRRRHLTGMLADDAVAFLEGQPRDQPFCLSVSFKAPHGPWHEPDPELVDLYRGAEIRLPPTATADAAASLFPFLRDSLAGDRGPEWIGDPAGLRIKLALYYTLISGMDLAVGRLRSALDRLGLADDTLILFTSDNGLCVGDRGLVGKWVMYEESIRVPLLVFDPRLPSGLRGRRIAEMALNIDVAPTLLDVAGVAPAPRMQGRSLLPLLHDLAPRWRDDWFYEHDFRPPAGYLPTVEGVRSRDWKYVRYLDPRSNRDALYDLRGDPQELHDVLDLPENRAVAERMHERWETLRALAA